MKPRKPNKRVSRGFLRTEGAPLFVLALSFALFFRQWRHPLSRIFLSLDTTVLYDPLYTWVHRHLAEGLLPLICDLSMHGAPVAAVSMAGVLSPALWLFHLLPGFTLAFNLLFLAPHALYLFGAYFLGRQRGLSRSASLLLAFLWAFNGHQMAQLDHLNVAWALAFFPWAFLALLRYLKSRKPVWLLTASLLLGLDLLSGHPQVFFMECLFFLFWALLSRDGWRLKAGAAFGLISGSALAASPLILFTAECLAGDSHLSWDTVDRFYHSWTPLNFTTLLFPWFFGRVQYDRAGGDYWWQYQFVEMQVAFSVVGLFFLLLFFLGKGRERRWVLGTSLFALAMALGKFFFVYPLVQSLPLFSFFRDPARYWFLAAWALGLGGAMAWDAWFGGKVPDTRGRKLAWGIAASAAGILAAAWLCLALGRPLLLAAASFFIRHFLAGDSVHTLPLSDYFRRIPDKLADLASDVDPLRPRVFLPLLFTAGLVLCVHMRRKWNLSLQKALLLALVAADLLAFRMPLGQAFYSPSAIPAPLTPAPQDRSLTLLYRNVSPLPAQYGQMAYPNMNLVSGRPNLVFDANPDLGRYAGLWADLGWFSWVYKNRDPLGFARHPDLLRRLGVDQVVSDTPLKLSAPFRTVQNRYPYVYSLSGPFPKAYLAAPIRGPDPIEAPDPGFQPPAVLHWGETRLTLLAQADSPSFLFLQKTFLPGWTARVNGRESRAFLCGQVMTGVALPAGKSYVELKFNPAGLRLGFFLFFLFSAAWVFFLFRARVP